MAWRSRLATLGVAEGGKFFGGSPKGHGEGTSGGKGARDKRMDESKDETFQPGRKGRGILGLANIQKRAKDTRRLEKMNRVPEYSSGEGENY